MSPSSVPAERPASSAGTAPVSLVVGAGPAGILTALYLARRGHEVHVYDRRPSPLLSDASDPHRAFAVILHERGSRAARGAGVSLCPGAGLQRMDAVGFDGCRIPLPTPKLFGPRHAFVHTLVEQAAAQGLPNLHWHWGTAFRGVDLDAKAATFEPADERSAGSADSASSSDGASSCSVSSGGAAHAWQQHYDLLVGADGCWSRVRRAAAAQDPALNARVQTQLTEYRVARGLPAAAAPGFAPQPAPADGTDAGSDAVQLRLLRPSGAAGSGPLAFAFITPSPAADGTADVLVSLNGIEPWAQLATPEALGVYLRSQFPELPEAWLLLMAERLAVAPSGREGQRVHASQLHARGGVVLVGDAAHGITPRTGNGMNAGLEDAALLDRLLGEHSVDALPAAFTAARLADATALLDLDGSWFERMGAGRWGRLNPAALVWSLSASARARLCRALPTGWVAPPAQVAMDEGLLPYAAVRAQHQRDGLLLASLALPLAAIMGLATAAAVGAGRLHAVSRTA